MYAEEFLPNSDCAMAGARFERRYRPHEMVFTEHDPALSVFRVISGMVIVFRQLADGRRQIHSFATRGDILALDFSGFYRLSAEAITEVSASVYDRTIVDHALETDPHFRRQIFSYMTDMLVASHEQAVLLGRKTALERTASFLLILYEKSPPSSRNSHIVLRMSRSDIADHLGLTFETVSRMFHQLKNLGVIALPKPDRFHVLDCSRLVVLAGLDSFNKFECVSTIAS